MPADLQTKEVNLGNPEINLCIMCPHCSKMYLTHDDKGQPLGRPASCSRCGCPLVAGDASEQFMAARAEEEANPALAAIGAKTRASIEGPPAHTSMTNGGAALRTKGHGTTDPM